MRVRYTTRALAEIEHLQDYIGRHDPAAAARTARTIRARVATLADQPGKGRPGRLDGTRELAVAGTPHVVACRTERRSIVVLAVIHGAQERPDSLQPRTGAAPEPPPRAAGLLSGRARSGGGGR